jgi:hypothetical protein
VLHRYLEDFRSFVMALAALAGERAATFFQVAAPVVDAAMQLQARTAKGDAEEEEEVAGSNPGGGGGSGGGASRGADADNGFEANFDDAPPAAALPPATPTAPAAATATTAAGGAPPPSSSVGLYKLNSVVPRLESAWFQPLNL